MSQRLIDPTRQGITPADMPDDGVGLLNFLEPYTVQKTLALMSTWNAGMDWGLHQMCRTLSDALAQSIGCENGDWTECREYPWRFCCQARRRVLGDVSEMRASVFCRPGGPNREGRCVTKSSITPARRQQRE